MSEPLVSIFCLTYNHERSIRQSLESFLMQKASFNFEILIHDDASTDLTPHIIREFENIYPEIVKPIYQVENQYKKRVGISRTFQLPRAKGKYVAFCEGDDYWVDPYKLQKQIDFLEKNPNYVLSHTSFNYYYEKNDLFIPANSESKEIISIANNGSTAIMQQILNGNRYRVQTVTAVVRTEEYKSVIETDSFLYKSGYFLMGDTPLWVGLLHLGKFHYLPEITSVYRVASGSACRSTNIKSKLRFDLSCEELRLYLANNNNFPIPLVKQFENDYFKRLLVYKAYDPYFQPQVVPYSKGFLYSKLIKLTSLSFVRFLLKIVIRIRLEYIRAKNFLFLLLNRN